MTKFATVLEKSARHVDLFTTSVPPLGVVSHTRSHRAYAELAAKLFGGQAPRKLVAFTAAHGGDGVTRTLQGLVAEVAHHGKRVIALNSALHSIHIPGTAIPDPRFESRPAILGTPFATEPKPPSDVLDALRGQYDCILIDCGALDSSADLLRLAPLADGIVLVVEAGRTGKEQIDRVAQVVREGQGTLIGCVLDKRRYPIPGWLYRLL